MQVYGGKTNDWILFDDYLLLIRGFVRTASEVNERYVCFGICIGVIILLLLSRSTCLLNSNKMATSTPSLHDNVGFLSSLREARQPTTYQAQSTPCTQ
jgi:hypothetical protein